MCFQCIRFLRPVAQEGPGLPLQRANDGEAGFDLLLVEDRFQGVAGGAGIPAQAGQGSRLGWLLLTSLMISRALPLARAGLLRTQPPSSVYTSWRALLRMAPRGPTSNWR
ncbi:hypothetical protein GCM10027202_07270 [Microvirgula curvata]